MSFQRTVGVDFWHERVTARQGTLAPDLDNLTGNLFLKDIFWAFLPLMVRIIERDRECHAVVYRSSVQSEGELLITAFSIANMRLALNCLITKHPQQAVLNGGKQATLVVLKRNKCNSVSSA